MLPPANFPRFDSGGRWGLCGGGVKTKVTILKYLGLEDFHHMGDRERSKNKKTGSCRCSAG